MKNNAVEKVERIERKKAEKERKRAEKQRLEEEKERINAEKRAREARIKAEKREMKEKEKRKKGKRANVGLIISTVCLSVLSLVLGGVLGYTYLTPSKSDILMESSYRRAFLDTVSYVDSIDNNLSKVLVTTDSGAMQKYFLDLAVLSELCESDLQELPLTDESKSYTSKFINQIGDFSKYLNNKLIDGENILESEKKALLTLKNANLSLKESLKDILDNMEENFKFISLKEGDKENLLVKSFNELQNLSIGYPELIYDGPFSDGLVNREIKGLKEKEISSAKAKELAKEYLFGYELELEEQGETAGQFECYNFSGENDGVYAYLQLSKKGGKLITMSFNQSKKEERLSEEEAINKGLEFFERLKIDNMKAVWVDKIDKEAVINYASTVNDVIIYPDLIKVKVSLYDGKITGYEAKNYYINHLERIIESPNLTKNVALTKVPKDLDVHTVRLAVVPVGTNGEALCYEIMGKIGEETYYYYINATTGRQVELFKVVKGTEGELLV